MQWEQVYFIRLILTIRSLLVHSCRAGERAKYRACNTRVELSVNKFIKNILIYVYFDPQLKKLFKNTHVSEVKCPR